jgi:hypothetical protein
MYIPNSFQEGNCPYCKHHLNSADLNSHWDSSKHYKEITCQHDGCNKKFHLSVDFDGSGHDDFMNNNPSKLESLVAGVPKD